MSVLAGLLRRHGNHTAALILLTLLTGGVFKLSAFAREAFIAARFGLSAVTDTYFGLQQFPITFATFMFGAFGLAFTPAYANARRKAAGVSWLPGLLLYGCGAGALLTLAMLFAGPALLGTIAGHPTAAMWNTLAILSLSFAPIACIGIWAGICVARGQNLWAMSMTGLPYLVMTIVLLLLYVAGALNSLSLPISMTAGFALVGIYALVRIVLLQPRTGGNAAGLLSAWKIPEFKAFLMQLGASSIENAGYAGNQLLIIFFLARAGTGAISANNCAMRIGMLGYSLVAQPLSQLVQARLCDGDENERPRIFRRWLLIVAAQVLFMAAVLYLLKVPVIRLVYMHGKFQSAELRQVLGILPAWIGYFVVLSLNTINARYLFTIGRGTTYVRRQLTAYGVANLLRFAFAAVLGAPWVIWCSVITEGLTFAWNVWTGLAVSRKPTELEPLVGVEEVCTP